MTKHTIISRWVVEWSFYRSRFIGLGIEVDGGKGGLSLIFSLPLFDVSLDIWSRDHLQEAAEELASIALANQIKENKRVDWSQYAPKKR